MNYGELGGVICPGCGDEVFRILEGRCVRCGQKKDRRTEADIEMSAALGGLKKDMARTKRSKARAVEDYWKAH